MTASRASLPARNFMRNAVAAWGIGAGFANITQGAVYTAFALALGANDLTFGILGAALPLMSVLQLAAARLIEQSGHSKRQVLIAGFTARMLWLIGALFPLLSHYFPHLLPSRLVLPLVIGCILLAGACQAFYLPAFFAWVGVLVPSRVRAPFFARRMQVGTIVAVVATIASGLIADGFPSLTTYAIVLAATALIGMMEFGFLARAPATPYPIVEHQGTAEASGPERPATTELPTTLLDSLRATWRDPAMRRFLAFTALMYAGYGSAGAFLWLHALQNLGLSKTLAGLIFVSQLVAQACTARFWGSVIQRHGTRPVLRLSAVGLTLLPIPWILTPPSSAGVWLPWAILTFTMFFGGIIATAYDLGTFNTITSLSPHLPRANVTAAFSIVADLSMVVASWASGALAQFLTGLHMEFGGLTITNYQIVFLSSLLLRGIAATIVAPSLYEPRANSTLATMKALWPEAVQAWGGLWRCARVTRPAERRIT